MTDAPLQLPPNTIRAHVVDGANIEPSAHIRPAEVRRDWMDAVPASYIYRCVPILAANTMGWELLNPVESRVVWDGGDSAANVKTTCDQPGLFTASSHFGSAIATWYVPFLFRTSPDLGLLICGPGNHEHNDAQPLDAFVRTDWLPFPFTLNWKISRANTPVIFKAGEPLARIMPFPIALIDNTQLEITALSSDPGFKAEVQAFGQARAANVAAQQRNAAKALQAGEVPKQDGVWNKQYVKAKGEAAGEGFSPHQTVFKPKTPILKL